MAITCIAILAVLLILLTVVAVYGAVTDYWAARLAERRADVHAVQATALRQLERQVHATMQRLLDEARQSE